MEALSPKLYREVGIEANVEESEEVFICSVAEVLDLVRHLFFQGYRI
ncbi:hypothetical protein [Porphyromonas gulae]|nr:hypothetical protein [Porphyromonas gulae]